MRRSTYIILGLLLVLSTGGYLWSDGSSGTPGRMLMQNPGGRVVFDHQKHAETYGIQCIRCHHDAPAPGKAGKSCTSCHGIAFDEEFRATHMNSGDAANECAACHHIEMRHKNEWHAYHAAIVDPGCRTCHHEDLTIEPEPKDCAQCHLKEKAQGRIPALKDAVHARCRTCHASIFDDGGKYCGTCHARAESAPAARAGKDISGAMSQCSLCHVTEPKKLVPGKMAAYHGLCIGCHRQKGGPVDNCAQCHTK